jgi:hypothetical protein
MPEQDAVLAITSGLGDMQQALNLVWEILLPAMQGDSLPDDSATYDTLCEKLSNLNIPPVQGKTSSPVTASVSGRRYKVDENDLNIETLTLDFSESGCTVRAKTARGEAIIPCGYGKWQRGQTKLFNEPWTFELAPITTSGAWTAEDTFTMVIRLYQTPFYQTGVFRFTENGLTVEMRGNVGFVPPETKRLTAHPV